MGAVAVLEVGLDGVVQAARLTHHGDSTVAAGDHLGETAGLGLGGHEEDIGGGVDLLGQGAVVGDEGADSLGEVLLQLAEVALILPLARTQHHELCLGVDLQHVTEHTRDDVHALMGGEAGDNRHDGGVLVLGEAVLLLEGQLILDLTRHVLGGEGEGDLGVGGGVVVDLIDAVEDTADLAAVAGQDEVEAVGVGGGHDLLGVGGRHGGDAVGALHGGLGQVDAPIVGHEGVMLGIDAENVLENGEIVLTLVLDVVDGEHRLDGGVLLVAVAVVGLEVDHRQGGLPVVGVENVGVVAELLHHLQHGAAEEGVALAVVEVTVQSTALEVVFVVHEVEGDVVLAEGADAAVLTAPGELELKDGLGLHGLHGGGGNLIVQGADHTDVGILAVLGAQSRGQRAHDVAKTARSGEGHDLRADEEDLLGSEIFRHWYVSSNN